MPTVVTETIGTDSRDYTQMFQWEAATDNDLVLADEVREGEIYDDADYATSWTIAGATVDATRFRNLFAVSGSEYDPVADTGVVNVASSPQASMAEAFARQRGFGIVTTGTSAGGVVEITADQCLLDAVFIDASSSTLGSNHTIRNDVNGTSALLINVIARGNNQVFRLDGGSASMFNCIANCDGGATGNFGFNGVSGVTSTNCISINAATADFVGAGTESFNASDDATASGTGSIINQDPALLFNSAATGDYRPASSGSNQIDAGTDLSGTFTTSFEPGVSHNSGASGWEMGAYDDSATPPPAATRNRAMVCS